MSSGDVYAAYGRFAGLEPGPVEDGLLTETGKDLRYKYTAKGPMYKAVMGQTTFMIHIFCGLRMVCARMKNALAKQMASHSRARI